MQKFWKLTNDFIVSENGVKLFQLELIVDCKWGTAGAKGGYIEKEDNLSGNAKVFGNAWVSGNAQVYGDAWVSGNAQVYGDARVFGNARVSGDAQVAGNARVAGDARVYGNAQVCGNAQVYGNARVYGGKFEKSPLQIQGTKHFVCIPKPGYLKIGCEERLISDWESNYIEIGDENDYSESEKEEYFEYIKIAKKIMHNYVE